MSKQDEINKVRNFLGWFEDNFAEEKYLMEVDQPDGSIKEEWISYLDHPEYLAACEALNTLEAAPKLETCDDLMHAVMDVVPNATFGEDNEGQIIVYTNKQNKVWTDPSNETDEIQELS